MKGKTFTTALALGSLARRTVVLVSSIGMGLEELDLLRGEYGSQYQMTEIDTFIFVAFLKGS